MKRIFVDTSAWDAIADKSDKNHVRALEYRDEIAGRYILLTSDYILDELYTLLLMNIGYQQTIRFKSKIDVLIAGNVLKIFWVTNERGQWALGDGSGIDQASELLSMTNARSRFPHPGLPGSL